MANTRDRGYGWVIVVAVFMCQLFMDGIRFSFGMMYLEFLLKFDSGKGLTAFIGSLTIGIYNLFGPVFAFIVNKTGCRIAAIIGAIVASLGFLLSYFATQLYQLYITYGAMQGFGFGLLFLSGTVTVSQYFKSKRALAFGISACGSGIGTLLFTPLVPLLLDTYTLRGIMLIFSGLSLQGVVFGLLYRPFIEENGNKNDVISLSSFAPSSENIVSLLGNKEECTNDADNSKLPFVDVENACHNDQENVPKNQEDELTPEAKLTDNDVLLLNDKEKNLPICSISQSHERVNDIERKHGNAFPFAAMEKLFPKHIVTNITFLLLMLSVLFYGIPVYIPFSMIPDYAYEVGCRKEDIVWLIPAMGIGGTLGRIASGWIGDRASVHRLKFEGTCLLLSGICTALVPLLKSFELLMVYSFFYGTLFGFGFGLLFLSGTVTVSQYFKSKRALAFGISACGSGIGTLLFTPLVPLLLDTYTLRGIMLIFSGLSLQGVVFGLLYRPFIEENGNKNDVISLSSFAPSSENIVSLLGNKEECTNDADNSKLPFVDVENACHNDQENVPKNQEDELTPEAKLTDNDVLLLNDKEKNLPICSISQSHERVNDIERKHGNAFPFAAMEKLFPKHIVTNITFLLLMLSVLFYGIPVYIPFSMIPDYAYEVGCRKEDIVWLIPAMGIGGTLGRIASGWIGDRASVHRLKFEGTCLLLSGICTALVPLLKSFELLMVYSFFYGTLFGFGFGLLFLSGTVTVSQYFKSKRALAFGISACGSGIGTLLFTPLVPLLLDTYTLRGIMLIFSGLSLQGVVFGLLYRPFIEENGNKNDVISLSSFAPSSENIVSLLGNKEECTNDADNSKLPFVDVENACHNDQENVPKNQEDELTPEAKLTDNDVLLLNDKEKNLPICSISQSHERVNDIERKHGNAFPFAAMEKLFPKHIVTNITFLLLMLSVLFYGIPVYIPFSMIPDYAYEVGCRKEDIVWLIPAMGIGGTLGRIASGWIGDRASVHRLKFEGTCLLLSGICTALVPLLKSFELLMVYSFFYGTLFGAIVTLQTVVILDYNDDDIIAEVMGILMFTAGLSTLLGPPIAGWIFDSTGEYTVSFLFTGAVCILSGLALFAVLCTASGRNVRNKRYGTDINEK